MFACHVFTVFMHFVVVGMRLNWCFYGRNMCSPSNDSKSKSLSTLNRPKWILNCSDQLLMKWLFNELETSLKSNSIKRGVQLHNASDFDHRAINHQMIRHKRQFFLWWQAESLTQLVIFFFARPINDAEKNMKSQQ